MFTSRCRGIIVAFAAGVLTVVGASAATATPVRPEKGIATGCLAAVSAAPPGLYAPPQECTDGPVS